VPRRERLVAAVREMREAYRVRRDELLEILDRVGLPASRPSGAFYVWTDVSKANAPSMDLAHSLIGSEHVAVAPGSAFGDLGEGYAPVPGLLQGGSSRGRLAPRAVRPPPG